MTVYLQLLDLLNPQQHQSLGYSFVDVIISHSFVEVESLAYLTPEVTQNSAVILWPASSALDAGLHLTAGYS